MSRGRGISRHERGPFPGEQFQKGQDGVHLRFRGVLDAEAAWVPSVHDAVGREVTQLRLPPGFCDTPLQLPGAGTYLYTLRRDGEVARVGRVVVY